MNKEQLHLLRSLRLDGQDDQKAGVSEARNAATAAGFTDQLDSERQTDRSMRDALAEIKIPAELAMKLQLSIRETLDQSAAQNETHRAEINEVSHPDVHRTFTRHSRRKWLGMGAGIAASIAVGGKLWWDTQAFTLNRFTRNVISISRNGISLALVSMDQSVVQKWLHLFSIRSASLMNPPSIGTDVLIHRDRDLTLATWSKEQYTLLLVSHESPEYILQLIS